MCPSFTTIIIPRKGCGEPGTCSTQKTAICLVALMTTVKLYRRTTRQKNEKKRDVFYITESIIIAKDSLAVGFISTCSVQNLIHALGQF